MVRFSFVLLPCVTRRVMFLVSECDRINDLETERKAHPDQPSGLRSAVLPGYAIISFNPSMV